MDRSAVKTPPLYAVQADALAAWRQSRHRGIVEAITGSGKTRIGVEAIREAVAAGRKAVVLVPRREVRDVWVRELRSTFPHLGVGTMGGGDRDTVHSVDVLVAVVNSAWNGTVAPPKGTLLVGDECHHYAAREHYTALDDGYEWRLGLTATLERSDRQEGKLLEYFGPIGYSVELADALADGIVAPFAMAFIGVDLTEGERGGYEGLTDRIRVLVRRLVGGHGLGGASKSALMSECSQIAGSRDQHPAKADVLEFLRCVAERQGIVAESEAKPEAVLSLVPAIKTADRSLIFTRTKDQAQLLARDLLNSGVNAAPIHSGHTPDDRRSRLSSFGSGKCRALVAPMVLDEGIDVPEADLAIVMSAFRTKRQMVQRMGRILRVKPDGRLARFALVYCRDTIEDPALGAHEGFLHATMDSAADLEVFLPDVDPEAVNLFLACFDPLEVAPPPRLVGEGPRPRRAAGTTRPADLFAQLGI